MDLPRCISTKELSELPRTVEEQKEVVLYAAWLWKKGKIAAGKVPSSANEKYLYNQLVKLDELELEELFR